MAVYEAPPSPVEHDDGDLIDNDGRRWTVTRDALISGGERYERVTGRHGLWFAFRSQYDDPAVATDEKQAMDGTK